MKNDLKGYEAREHQISQVTEKSYTNTSNRRNENKINFLFDLGVTLILIKVGNLTLSLLN